MGKASCRLASRSQRCLKKRFHRCAAVKPLARPICRWQTLISMKRWAILSGASICAVVCAAFPQTPAAETKSSTAAQLEALAQKIDEQNAKIDALSQEILKLEQQLSHIRPGVMIGESAPSSGSVAPAASPSHFGGGNTHVVARGETLTSIAKMYRVTVDDLQKTNHIEDGRKLQAGQTILIPVQSPTGSPTPSP
jgi:LysM repeat protein